MTLTTSVPQSALAPQWLGTGTRRARVSPRVRIGLVRAGDGVAVAGAGLVCAWRLGSGGFAPAVAASLLAAALAMLAFELAGLYRQAELARLRTQLVRLGLGLGLAFTVLAVLGSFAGPLTGFSPGAAASWLALAPLAAFALVTLSRGANARFARRLAKAGRLSRRAVLFGTGEISVATIAALEADLDSDVAIVGVFDDRGSERNANLVGGYPWLGTSNDLVAFARATRVDLVILALPLQAESRLAEIVRRLKVLPVAIKVPASATPLKLARRAYSHAGRVAMIDLIDLPMADWGPILKRGLDIAVSLSAIVALSPVLAAIACCVRLECRGPALFRQTRFGYNNQPVEVWKFRSMFTDQCDAQAGRLVTRNDARVTPLGRALRKSSLDELPQLFNVLRGDLSLVGPRPHAMAAKAADRLYDDVVDGYTARHRVKPGITGWAQINGWRGETDTEAKIAGRVAFDLAYIENWSLAFDLYILAATPLALFDTKAAY